LDIADEQRSFATVDDGRSETLAILVVETHGTLDERISGGNLPAVMKTYLTDG
jgi:hypothetical protein